MKKAFLKKFMPVVIIFFVIPLIGLGASKLFEEKHDASLYRSLQRQLRQDRKQLEQAGVTPDKVCRENRHQPAIQFFCAHYGRIEKLRQYSLWALCLGGVLIAFLTGFGWLIRGISTHGLFLICSVWIGFLGLAVSIVLQTLVAGHTIILFSLLVMSRNVGFGAAEGIGLLAILFILSLIKLAVIVTIKGVPAVLEEFESDTDDDDVWAGRMSLLPGKCLMDYCCLIYASDCHNKIRGRKS